MPSTFGTKLSVTLFGQSHSAGVGCVVEGLPSWSSVTAPVATSRMTAAQPPGPSGLRRQEPSV